MSHAYRPLIGDLVVIHDPRLAEELGQADHLGVVVKVRKGSARVIFLPGRENYWIEDLRLYPHPDAERVADPLLLSASRALRQLRPEEAEFEAVDGNRVQLHALCMRVDADGMQALADELGEHLEGWEVQPYGMALFTVVLRLSG